MRLLPACVLALFLLTGTSLGEQAAELTDLKACRLDAELISLSFSYQGGACEETGDPSLEVSESGDAIIEVPVVSTSDVCTMQVVPVSLSSAVAVPEQVSAVSVQLVDPAGEVKAAGKTDIAPSSPDCVPPKPTH